MFRSQKKPQNMKANVVTYCRNCIFCEMDISFTIFRTSCASQINRSISDFFFFTFCLAKYVHNWQKFCIANVSNILIKSTGRSAFCINNGRFAILTVHAEKFRTVSRRFPKLGLLVKVRNDNVNLPNTGRTGGCLSIILRILAN